MSRSITVNTHQAKLVCAMLLDVGLAFEVPPVIGLTPRQFVVEVDATHALALEAIHASVLRRTAGQPSK